MMEHKIEAKIQTNILFQNQTFYIRKILEVILAYFTKIGSLCLSSKMSNP